MSEFRVVVCGGGIAAVEGLLRLRRLLGSSVDIELVAPNDDLVIRPLAVSQPFAFGPPSRYDLGRIVTDNDAAWSRTRSPGLTATRRWRTPAAGRAFATTRS